MLIGFLKKTLLVLVSLSMLVFAPTISSSNFLNKQLAIMINNPQLINHDIVSEMLDWISKNSNYPVVPGLVPDIRFANQEFMNKEWKRTGGGDGVSIKAMTTVTGVNRHITIYLPIDFDWNDYRNRTNLVHELVHFQQFTYLFDKRVECTAVLEYEAYLLAIMWFSEQEVIDLSFVNDRMKQAKSYSTCSE